MTSGWPDQLRVAGVLERGAELESIERAVAAAAEGEGRLLVIAADAGLGKSTLVDAAAAAAAERGFDVLRATGSDLERDVPFGVTLRLFGRAVRTAGGVPPGPPELARPLLMGERAPAELGGAQTRDGILHGLSWLALDMAERNPVALLVDDAHWADTLSLRLLLTLMPSVAGAALLVVVAARPAEPGSQHELVLRLIDDPRAVVVRPGPLGEDSVAELCGDAADPDFVSACHEVTGGNPLLLRQLLLALADEGVPHDRAGAARVHEIGPEPVSRAVRLSLGRLPAAAGELARAVAVLADHADPRTAAALAGLSGDEAADAASALETAGLFRRADPLGFAHPILRAAVYEALPPSRRALEHRRAARLMLDDAPVERVAAQLLHSTPGGEEWVVDVLVLAAERASERGAPGTAAAHLKRALDEPPAPERRHTILAGLGRAQAAAGEETSVATLERAIGSAPSPRERAELGLDLGRALLTLGRAVDAAATFEAARSEVEDEDDLAIELEAAWVGAAIWDPAHGPSALARVAPLLEPGAIPRTPGERLLLAQLAGAEALQGGDRARAVEWGRRAWGEGALLDLAPDESALGAICGALSFSGLHAEADAMTTAMIERARADGSATGFAAASFLRGGNAVPWGRLSDAVADLEAALAGRQAGWDQFTPRVLGLLATAFTELGEDERARAVLGEAVELEAQFATSVVWASLLELRGQVLLALDDADGALASFEQAGERIRELFGEVGPGAAAWRAGAAEALARLGRHDDAFALADEQLAAARRWGAPGPLAAALRARGLAAGPGRGLDDLAAAVAAAEVGDARMELVRSLNAHGRALRAARRRAEAQDVLRRALDVAEQCGARRQADTARAELQATGARPRRPRSTGMDALTPSELRVVRLAAGGLSNREIAQRLFVTRKAIQWHLGNAYRKLGIASREELATALNGDGQASG